MDLFICINKSWQRKTRDLHALNTWLTGTLPIHTSTAYLSFVSMSKQNLLSIDSVFLLTQYFRVKSKGPWYKRRINSQFGKKCTEASSASRSVLSVTWKAAVRAAGVMCSITENPGPSNGGCSKNQRMAETRRKYSSGPSLLSKCGWLNRKVTTHCGRGV